MSNCLILLTSSFPFKGEETFLENEISFLEKSFDKIIILALELSKGDDITRVYPSNADVYNTSSGKKKILRIKDTAKGALNIFKNRRINPQDAEAIGSSLSRKAFFSYFEERSIRQFNECIGILDRFDFSKFDSITIYSYWFFSICLTGVYIKDYIKSVNHNVKLISRAHRYDLYAYINRLDYLPFRNTLAKECDAVFACSENGRDYLKKTIPDYSEKFFCSYLGTTDYGTAGYDKDDFHIVTCARTNEIKRIDRFASALENLKDSGLKIRWTHIGDGKMQDTVKKIAETRLSFMKTEFPGNIDNYAVYNFYKTKPVSLYVNVSLNEGLPVSIMEAVSFGIPVIATDVGGTGEIVKDGYNGFLLDKDFSDNDLIRLIKIIYNMNDEEYEKLRSNSRLFWEKQFNASDNYPLFIKDITTQEITA